jgi:hypothetical protein
MRLDRLQIRDGVVKPWLPAAVEKIATHDLHD